MPPLTRVTHAKINLMLHITGRRDDGYHLLESVIAFADVGDTLQVEEGKALSLRVTGPYADGLKAGNNLVLKAAKALLAHTKIAREAHLALEKNLPVASGMGGGSGDAAAAFVLLNEYWQLNLTPEILKKIAFTLGADVPVCLENTSSFLSGVGENLTPIKLPSWDTVLINPNVALSTKEIFAAYAQPAPAYDAPITELPGKCDEWLAFLRQCRNALQDAAIRKLPEIRNILKTIEMTEGCCLSRMSGSGATCFGLYLSQSDAEMAAKRLKKHYPDSWVRQCRIL